MTGQNTAATGTAATGSAAAPNGGAIDVDAWRRRIRADAFGRYHYEMGIAIVGEGNLPAAIQHLQTAIDTDPTLVDAYYHLGRVLRSQGRTAEADALQARARAQDPGFPAGTLVRMALRTLDRNAEGDGAEQAVDLAGQALAHDPAHREAPWIAALIQARQGRFDAAAALRAADTAPRTTGRDEAADLAWRFYRLAETGREAGRTADAGAAVACALVLDADLPQALGLSAILRHEAGQPAAAEPLLRRAVALQPGLPWLHAHLGSTLLTLGREGEALAELRLAAADMSGDAWVMGQLGIALLGTGAYDEAAATLRASLTIKPGVPWVMGHLAKTLFKAGHVNEASAILEQTLRHDPASGWIVSMLADIRAVQTRFGEAAALYRRALCCDPAMGWSMFQLGMALFKAGRVEEARSVLTATGKRFPEEAVDSVLGLVLLTLGKGDEAAQTFRRALNRTPLPALHEGMVTALLMTGQTALAVDAFAAGWAAGMDPLAATARLLIWPPHAGVVPALTALRAAVPGAAWPTVLTGLALIAEGDTAGATALLNDLAGDGTAQADPVWGGTASIVLGIARTVAGDAAGGLADLDRGLALAGAAGARWRTYRGLALHSLGRLPEAETEHRATLAVIPDDSAAYLSLAMTLDAQGRIDEGRSILLLAMGQNPGRVRALSRLLPPWAGPVLERLRGK